MPEYDQYLDDYVYSKIWSELSETDKRVLSVIAMSGQTKVSEIRNELGMSSESALITWLSCTDHVTAHALMTWLFGH